MGHYIDACAASFTVFRLQTRGKECLRRLCMSRTAEQAGVTRILTHVGSTSFTLHKESLFIAVDSVFQRGLDVG
jgi:hypothetical protein